MIATVAKIQKKSSWKAYHIQKFVIAKHFFAQITINKRRSKNKKEIYDTIQRQVTRAEERIYNEDMKL